MAEQNDFVTTSLEHSLSGTFRFIGGTIAVPVGIILPSGIQNEIIFIQPSGILAIFNNGWLTAQAL